MAERARSRHSNTDLAHNNLHFLHYRTRSEDQKQNDQEQPLQQQQQNHYSSKFVIKENKSKKHENVLQNYSDDDHHVPHGYDVIARGRDVIIEEDNMIEAGRTKHKPKHNQHTMFIPNRTKTIQQQQQQQELPESKSNRSKNSKRSFSEQHYLKVKIK